MDAFEAVRDAAADLHVRLAGEGAVPPQPMDLVRSAIDHLGLELAWLPSGDPALKGARGVFDEQSGAIFAEDEGEPGERGLLIAHEIGHVRLHAGPAACSAHDIDPAR